MGVDVSPGSSSKKRFGISSGAAIVVSTGRRSVIAVVQIIGLTLISIDLDRAARYGIRCFRCDLRGFMFAACRCRQTFPASVYGHVMTESLA